MHEFKIKIIRTEDEYDKAIERFEELFDKNPGEDSRENEEYKLLALLIKDFEKRNSVMRIPDPIEHIKFLMQNRGLTRKDLERYIGTSGRVSEILSGKRKLTLTMIKKLNRGLGISAEVLLNQS